MMLKRILALLTMICASAQAGIWMPSIFSDGMVLQCDKPVPVWGEADPGTEVTVEFAGQKKTAVADGSNHWNVTLDPLAVSSEPRNMTVSAISQTPILQYSNLLVGEVWVLSGQSNMGWTLANSTGGAVAVAAADYPWLRVFSQWPTQGAADEPARDVTGGQWGTCTPANAGNLSGVGFFFARALQASLPTNTPIALINTQMGGTYAECWIDFQTLENTPSAAPMLEKAADEVVPGGTDPDGFWGIDNFRRPSALYNGKVAPLQSFGVRGVIWYQGEGNSQDWMAPGYAGTLTALVNSWRSQWQQPDLPFLVVQLPRYHSADWSRWTEVRSAQAQVANDLDGVEVAVTIDLGEEFEIHPADKEPVGERLAQLARAKVYGQAVECHGPFFLAAEIQGSDIFIDLTFDDGLYFRGGVAKGFEVCRADGQYVSAQAEIMPDGRLRVFGSDVLMICGVRYGWFNWGEVSLFNGQDLPAAPFSWVTEFVYTPVDLKSEHNGNLYTATNWVGDVLPTAINGLVGLFDGTEMPLGGTFEVPGVIYDFSLLQEGGLCMSSGNLAFRGGATNETVAVPGKTVWTIDDPVNDPASFTNLYVAGDLTIWSHMGGPIELNLLQGRIEVGGAFQMFASGRGVLNIKDGVFRSQFFTANGADINLMAGGTANVDLGQLETADRNVVFNFESGFKGSITISLTETGEAFGASDWQVLADAGKLTIDGVSVGLDYFGLSKGGTTLQHIGALPGLTVAGGALHKEGVPYRAAGMNYCDMFVAMIHFPEYAGQTEYRTMEGLWFLGEQGIPFVRFWACGFWPSDWDLYFADKDEWFSRMDLLVATAEEVNVGLIPSLFWRTETYPELMGEYRNAWGDPASLTRQFMSNYVHEVVGRYKDSPAIWGWEFANEVNLVCDLPNWDNPKFWNVIPHLGVVGPATDYTSESNRMTYAIAESVFHAFAQEVRKLDTHRFITTGSSSPRLASWNNRMNGTWIADSYSEAKEAFGWMQPPSAVNMASVHVYPGTNGLVDYAEASGTADILLRYREFCDDQNQAMFAGEYRSFNGDSNTTLDEKRASEDALLNDLIVSGADLIAQWVFDYTYDRTTVGIIRATNDYTWVLDTVREADAKMRGEESRSLIGVPVDWFDQNGIAPTGSLTLAQVEAQDLNGNGMAVWEDYMAGFQPLETGVVFSITDFQRLENSVPGLSWWGGTNGPMTPYVIQSTTNLLDSASWQTIGTKSREPGTNSWTGTVTSDPTCYYRVLATP